MFCSEKRFYSYLSFNNLKVTLKVLCAKLSAHTTLAVPTVKFEMRAKIKFVLLI